MLAVLALGCDPKTGLVGQAGTEGSESGPSEAGEDDADAADDGGGDGGTLGSGDDGNVDDTGPVPNGEVDCAALDPNGPTVAGGELGPSGFPPACNPRFDTAQGPYRCCSDDPAAEAGELPAYMGKNIDGGMPYFAGTNNDLGTWGLCVKTSDIPFGSGLTEPAASNCPVPCDPTWDEGSVDTVCGSGRVCCQTQELQPEDCVVDPVSGQWRPVDGTDIGVMYEDGVPITTWAPNSHTTHQDPNGNACLGFAGGDLVSPIFTECIRNLHVTNHRGYCMALGPGQTCPLQQPGYVDACAQLNGG